jgi:hypothetical protein
MRKPIELLDLDSITMRVKTCLILHNMGVSDRVMDGDVTADYNPTNILLHREEGREGAGGDGNVVRNPDEEWDTDIFLETETAGVFESPIAPTTNRKRGRSGSPVDDGESPLGINMDMSRRLRWGKLSDPVEHSRLRAALMQKYH